MLRDNEKNSRAKKVLEAALKEAHVEQSTIDRILLALVAGLYVQVIDALADWPDFVKENKSNEQSIDDFVWNNFYYGATLFRALLINNGLGDEQHQGERQTVVKNLINQADK